MTMNKNAKPRASVDRLIACTRDFLDTAGNGKETAYWNSISLFRMQHAASLEKMDRRIRYDLCCHMAPMGYCARCREEFPEARYINFINFIHD